MDCGFLRLPTTRGFDTVLLKRDEYKVVLPVGHPLAAQETVDIAALDGQPFLLLEHGGKTEVSALLEGSGVRPDIRFPPGRILPSWPWWSGDSVSVSCLP